MDHPFCEAWRTAVPQQQQKESQQATCGKPKKAGKVPTSTTDGARRVSVSSYGSGEGKLLRSQLPPLARGCLWVGLDAASRYAAPRMLFGARPWPLVDRYAAAAAQLFLINILEKSSRISSNQSKSDSSELVSSNSDSIGMLSNHRHRLQPYPAYII